MNDNLDNELLNKAYEDANSLKLLHKKKPWYVSFIRKIFKKSDSTEANLENIIDSILSVLSSNIRSQNININENKIELTNLKNKVIILLLF